MSSASLSAPRALCVTASASLKKTLRRTLNATGSSVEFTDTLDGGNGGADLVILDREARREASLPRLMQLVGERGKIIMVGDSIEDDEVVSLLRDHPMDHVISDPPGDEGQLVVTSVKLLSGDIFGLEKYLSWGVKVYEQEIDSYEEKRIALLTVAQHAKEVGARRQVIAKIESVTDELLMNALYDAPAIRSGVSRQVRIDKSTDGTVPSEDAAVMRYACDGRYFAVSVSDRYGELHKEAILDHLTRARQERGRPKGMDGIGGGAGLGLYFILSSVTRFIANVRPGELTEVVCLFDLRQSGREAESCARSLHIFRADGDDGDDE